MVVVFVYTTVFGIAWEGSVMSMVCLVHLGVVGATKRPLPDGGPMTPLPPDTKVATTSKVSLFNNVFSESVGDIHRPECPRVCHPCAVDVKYLTVPIDI